MGLKNGKFFVDFSSATFGIMFSKSEFLFSVERGIPRDSKIVGVEIVDGDTMRVTFESMEFGSIFGDPAEAFIVMNTHVRAATQFETKDEGEQPDA